VIGDRFHLETMGYRPEHAAHSPGKNAIFRALERLCAAEVRWVDYGVGDAMYKRVLGSHWDQTVTRRIFGRTAAAGRARRVAGAAEATHVAAARLADRLGALDLLRTAWRRRLERSSNGDSAT
jgi:CelD/BcsL family acetyltransferase involved in cellulose biosynthesis